MGTFLVNAITLSSEQRIEPRGRNLELTTRERKKGFKFRNKNVFGAKFDRSRPPGFPKLGFKIYCEPKRECQSEKKYIKICSREVSPRDIFISLAQIGGKGYCTGRLDSNQVFDMISYAFVI